MAKLKPTVTGLQAYAKVAVPGVKSYRTEVILSSYARTELLFQPEYLDIGFSIGAGEDGIDWPSATVYGWAEGNRGGGRLTRRATIKLAEDEEGRIDHWPDYARLALVTARKTVKL